MARKLGHLMTNEFYMNLAINEAWKYQFLTYENPAVGCVIVDKNGRILSIDHAPCRWYLLRL